MKHVMRLAALVVVASVAIGASSSLANHSQGQGSRGQVERTITQTADGYVMTLTSENPSIVTKLQNRQIRATNSSELTRTKNNITDGIEIVVSTTDSNILQRLQKHAQRAQKRIDALNARRS